MTAVSEPHTLISTLLAPGSTHYERREAAIALHSLLGQATGVVETGQDPRFSTYLPGGKAICAIGAASCLRDYSRTRAFMQGTLDAVRAARERFGAPVHLLYAGCGPFAPLVMPLVRELGPDELRITLLDIHERSLTAARTALALAGGLDHVEAMFQADAITYRHEGRLPLHVVVSETMNLALEREPQVAITRNLARQMPEGGVLVPESIRLFLETEPPGDGTGLRPPTGRRLADLFEVSLAAARTWPDGDRLPAATVTLPDDYDGRSVRIGTEIQVFGTSALAPMESSLTQPFPLRTPTALQPGEQLQFEYEIGEKPGLRRAAATLPTAATP